MKTFIDNTIETLLSLGFWILIISMISSCHPVLVILAILILLGV